MSRTVISVLQLCLGSSLEPSAERGGHTGPSPGRPLGPFLRSGCQPVAAATPRRWGESADCEKNLYNRLRQGAVPPPRPRSLLPSPEPARLRSSFAANGTKRGGCLWWRGPSARAGRRGGGSRLCSPLAPGSRFPAAGVPPASGAARPDLPRGPFPPPVPAAWTRTPGSSAKASWSHPQVSAAAARGTGAT